MTGEWFYDYKVLQYEDTVTTSIINAYTSINRAERKQNRVTLENLALDVLSS